MKLRCWPRSRALIDTYKLTATRRAKLQYSDADCGAFINRAGYTHHPACRGYTVENGRLASSGRYRENSVDWDTNHTHPQKSPVIVATISAHTTDILVPTPAVRMQAELQTSYYKGFICIIHVANYRPAEIGGKIIIQHLIRDRSLRIIIIIFPVVDAVSSGLSCRQRETNQCGV